MNSNHYLVLSGIVGGVIGSLLTALLVPPVTAQRDKFGEIECTGLRVVDKDGDDVVTLSWNIQHGGRVSVLNKQALGPQTSITNDGIAVSDFFGANGIIRVVRIGVDGHGGFVSAAALGKVGTSKVWLGVDEHGGRVDVHGKDGGLSATARTDKNGGRVSVGGKGKGEAAMGINEYGNGTVSTWDKNGYRQK